MTNLDPCPFCGSTNIYVGGSDDLVTTFAVFCDQCCASGPRNVDAEKAAELWNDRVAAEIKRQLEGDALGQKTEGEKA